MSQEDSMPMDVNPSLYMGTKRNKTKEESIEELEAYYLETMFLPNMIGQNQSLMTEEEKAEAPMSVDSDVENQILIKELAKKLAKQDILRFKRQLMPKRAKF
jgi:hypothetical protein